MAANQVLLKKSSVAAKVPLVTDLAYGEVALNYADGKLYFKNSSNVIQSFVSDLSSYVTLTGTQTLTNKTLTSPTITGSVGIGTASPDSVLHISSGTNSSLLRLQQTGANNQASIDFLTTGGSAKFELDQSGNAVFRTQQSSLYFDNFGATGSIFFRTNGSNTRMEINSSGIVSINNLTASQAVFTDASKNLVSKAVTGTGDVVLSASPTLTGTLTAATITASANATINGVSIGKGASNLSQNLAFGPSALSNASSSGIELTAIGNETMQGLVTGNYNTAIGSRALRSLTGGTVNTAIGNSSLTMMTGGFQNVSIGDQAGGLLTTGSNNTFIGNNAGKVLNNGIDWVTINTKSIYIGNITKSGVDGADNEIVIGYDARGLGSNKTVIGTSATIATKLFGTLETVGDATINGINITRGAGALTGNMGVGQSALASASLTGLANTGIGRESLLGNTTGANNVGLGFYTLRGNTTGSNNVAVGPQSLFANITGSNNIAVGESALNSNTNSLNIAVGTQALTSNTTGNNNVVLGYQGGYLLANNVTQVNNLTQSIFIGNNVRANTVNDTNSIAIGHNAQSLGDNKTVIGNSATILTKLFGALETTGDITVKAGATTGSATITTPTTELVLSETGDQFGASTLRLQNRNGMNGALFDNSASAIGCVDFGFKTRTNNIDYQQLFRYEVRAAARSISIGSIGEFQVMGASGLCANTNQTYVVPTTASTSTTTGALRVGGGAGIAGNLYVGGNLVVNGSTTTINSNTVSVDDKNIELGGVVSTSPTGTVTAGSAVITALTSTANIIPGSVVTALTGAGTITLPAGTTVDSIDSATQITLSAALTGTGGPTTLVTLTITGATDVTANGGGITLKGTTDKTISWSTLGWTSSEDFNLVTGKSYKINGTSVLSATTLGSGVTASSLTSLGTIATLNVGTITASADATINGVKVGKGANNLSANTALGNLALDSASNSGDGYNTAVGASAIKNNTSGAYNTAVGAFTLLNNSTGGSNTAFGLNSLIRNNVGNSNVGIGTGTLAYNFTGSNSVAIGWNALANSTTFVNTLIITAQGSGYLPASGTTTYNNIQLSHASGSTVDTGGTYPVVNITVTNGAVTNAVIVSRGTRFIDTTTVMTCSTASIGGGSGSGFRIRAETLADTSGNVAVGYQSLYNNTIGQDNAAIGFNSLYQNTSGGQNMAFGTNALLNNSTGSRNAAIGFNSMVRNSTGTDNMAVGSEALYNNTTGFENIGIGRYANLTNETGSRNVAIGAYSLRQNTSSNNTAIGGSAASGTTTGSGNSVVGYAGLTNNISGSDNSVLGNSAAFWNITGSNSVAIGKDALYYSTTFVGSFEAPTGGTGYTPASGTATYNNVQLSYSSGTAVATGGTYPRVNITVTNGSVSNVAIVDAGSRFYNNTTVMTCSNTLIGGSGSGFLIKVNTLSDTSGNVAVGHQALHVNYNGQYQTAVGYRALYNSNAAYNTAVGYEALGSNTSGVQNMAFGFGALAGNTTGSRNVAIGFYSVWLNTTGSENVGLGSEALQSNRTGGQNIAIGRYSVSQNLSGSWNIGVGGSTLQATTGSNNTAIGGAALQTNVAGSSNVAIGFLAGSYYGASPSTTAITQATESIFIGNTARGSSATGDSNSIVIGSNALGLGSNTTVIGNSSTTKTKLFGTLEATGDATINSVTVGRGSGNQPTNVALGVSALAAPLVSSLTNQNVAVGTNTLSNIKSSASVINFTNDFGSSLFQPEEIANVQLTYLSGAQVEAGGTYPIVNLSIYDDGEGGFYLGQVVIVNGGSKFTSTGTYVRANLTSPAGQIINYEFYISEITSGAGNTAIGYDAGKLVNIGQDCVYIGRNANPSSSSLPPRVNEIVIGAGAVGSGNNTARIGNSSTTLYVAAIETPSINVGTSFNAFANQFQTSSSAILSLSGNSTSTSHSIYSNQTSGTLTIGGTSTGATAGTLTFGQAAGTSTVNIGTGVVGSIRTKTINIGTSSSTPSGTTTINVGATVNTTTTVNGAVTLTATTQAINIGNSQTSGELNLGTAASRTAAINIGTSATTGEIFIGGNSSSSTGQLIVGRSPATQTVGLAVGSTASGSTKTINIGLNGASGSTTNINIGSTGGTSTTTLNGSVSAVGRITSTVGGNAIALNGSGSNYISYSATGVNPPSFTTSSTGTKIILYPTIAANAADYAIGIENNTIWNSVPNTGSQFKWYGGTTLAATLTGTGNLSIPGGATIDATTQNIDIGGTASTATGPITLGRSVGVQTVNIASGATASGSTKTVNIGTAGLNGSTTNINIGSQVAGAVDNIRIDGNVGILTAATTTYQLQVNGAFAATTKSFVIPHPTKSGKQLRYGSLEGPENGVYIRGRLKGNKIELPEYWTKLVDPDSITVDLTPIGKHQKLYVEGIADNTVIVGNDNMLNKEINCFYVVYGERCDVDKLQVEID